MRKGIFILILSLFFINCKEKTKTIDKTYEQLEAELLCDVLPEIIPPFIQLDLVPPQPQSSDLLNKIDETFSEDDSIVINLKSKLEYIKKLAKEKNKIHINTIGYFPSQSYFLLKPPPLPSCCKKPCNKKTKPGKWFIQKWTV